ncbi:MAG: BON domain-containing protein [Alphaproteobacteria bacterium]|nr:BON domain-containing protein [Alphaproteobacteria bacterium]
MHPLAPLGRGLCLCAGLLALAGCAPALFAGGVTGIIFAAQERSVGEAVDDFTIQTSLEAKLLQASEHLSRRVNLKVVEGRVLMTGIVNTPEDERTALALARDTGGVREVIDELEVGKAPGLGKFVSDTWISTVFRARLSTDSQVAFINYGYEVSEGRIYLIGIAGSPGELDRVTEHARTIKGVREVVSHIVLKSDPRRPA